MKTLERFVSGVALLVCLSFALSAAAQGRFSQEQAQAIINTKDWNRLLAYGKAWAQAEPNNATAWYVIGRAYGSKYYNIGLGQPADAAIAYERAVQLNPQVADAWDALGVTYQELERWKESVAALERATQLAPERTGYWDFLSTAYMHTRQFSQAAAAAGSIEGHARNANDWFKAGAAYYAVAPFYDTTPMYQRSKAAFVKVLQLEPRNAAAWTNLGTTEQALGNTKAAFDAYAKGAQLGNAQGSANYGSLENEIKACMIERNRLMSPGIIYGASAVITAYNMHCAQYTGKITIVSPFQ